MRTRVYVDGFNLYYGALKGTPFKWLDLVRLAYQLLPAGYSVTKLKYFTVPPTCPVGMRLWSRRASLRSWCLRAECRRRCPPGTASARAPRARSWRLPDETDRDP